MSNIKELRTEYVGNVYTSSLDNENYKVTNIDKDVTKKDEFLVSLDNIKTKKASSMEVSLFKQFFQKVV